MCGQPSVRHATYAGYSHVKLLGFPLNYKADSDCNYRNPNDDENILAAPRVLIGQGCIPLDEIRGIARFGLLGLLGRYGFQGVLCQNAAQPGHRARDGITLVLCALIL